jgi:branched-chain amino acid transport system substrate-binding protein
MPSFHVRRSAAGLAAGLVALALVAGCGGSAIPEAATDGGSTVQQEAGTETGTETGAVAGTDAGAPAGAGTATVPGAAANTSTGTTPGAANTGTGTAAAATGAKPGKAASGAAAGTSGLTVEQLVASHPIFGGTAACKPATLSEVPLGNVSTLSGVLGELFSPVVNALQVFVASQNACGGLNGHKIKLYFDDDQGDPSTASTKVQSMIQTKHVLAFVGNIEVLTVEAVAPIIKKYGIPIIGSDVTNNSWFTNPLMFPQGAPQQSIAYGFLLGATQRFKMKNVGLFYCIEVPRSCLDTARAFEELAPQMGAVVKKSLQVSLTQPSYVQQCLEMKNAGVEVLALNMDAASMKRIARSCEQVGFRPKTEGHPLGVGYEKQFLGNPWLGGAYVPLNVFGWMASSTPAEKYYQAMVAKYDPGFDTGGAASLGWTAGALLVAASAGLSETNPTTQQFLDTLWQFKGQKFTTLGGLTGPRTFGKDVNPQVPYCLFEAYANADDSGWASVTSKPTCTDIQAPSDPNHRK